MEACIMKSDTDKSDHEEVAMCARLLDESPLMWASRIPRFEALEAPLRREEIAPQRPAAGTATGGAMVAGHDKAAI
ncbi:hypothetical protein ACLOJK_039253 [Asimina triloba]